MLTKHSLLITGLPQPKQDPSSDYCKAAILFLSLDSNTGLTFSLLSSSHTGLLIKSICSVFEDDPLGHSRVLVLEKTKGKKDSNSHGVSQ